MQGNAPYIGPLPKRVRAVIAAADRFIADGAKVHFKWSCAACGQRLTFEEPNSFFVTGECDKCHHVTDLRTKKAKLNFLVIAMAGRGDPREPQPGETKQ